MFELKGYQERDDQITLTVELHVVTKMRYELDTLEVDYLAITKLDRLIMGSAG
jgi:hypothetical protein